ncbi:hypothetical protein C817_01594 [Dorea sp. 5-2]|nr:hypothetical protein C817_01594 [Dorea sp. 5-2]
MKMKKMVALLAAGVLCLGMSTTAFAAISPTKNNAEYIGEKGKNDFINSAGLEDFDSFTEAGQKEAKAALEVLNDSEKLAKELQNAGYNTNGKDIVVMGAGMYEFGGYKKDENGQYVFDKNGYPIWENKELPEEGADIRFSLTGAAGNILDQAKDLKHGDTIYVMHYLANGTWQVMEATVEMVDGIPYVTVHMDSLSPVAFIKVMSNGEVVKLDPVTKKPVKAPTTKASPKTGEF